MGFEVVAWKERRESERNGGTARGRGNDVRNDEERLASLDSQLTGVQLILQLLKVSSHSLQDILCGLMILTHTAPIRGNVRIRWWLLFLASFSGQQIGWCVLMLQQGVASLPSWRSHRSSESGLCQEVEECPAPMAAALPGFRYSATDMKRSPSRLYADMLEGSQPVGGEGGPHCARERPGRDGIVTSTVSFPFPVQEVEADANERG